MTDLPDLPEDLEPSTPRWRGTRWWVVALVAACAVMVAALAFAHSYVGVLWYEALGYGPEYHTLALTRSALFVGTAVITLVGMGSSIAIAAANRPPSDLETVLERYRAYTEPIRVWVWVGLAVVAALALGAAETSHWRDLLLWWNGGSFGATDPWFGRDAGFYVFELPWWHDLVNLGLTVGALTLVTAVAAHYLYGGIELAPQPRWSRASQRHLALIVAGLLALKGIDFWIGRYDVVRDVGPLGTGATWSDLHAVVPGKEVLCGAAAVCVVLFGWNVRSLRWRTPLVALVLLFVSSVVLGLIVPAVVQDAAVRPHELDRERPNLVASIAATKVGYGLGDVKTVALPAPGAAAASALRSQPLLDLSVARVQAQAAVPGTTIDGTEIDRYAVSGVERPVVTSWASPIGGPGRLVATFADGSAGSPNLHVAGDLWFGPGARDVTAGSSGPAGVALSNPVRRAAYALATGDLGLFGSQATIATRLDPLQRAAAIAPWLTLDQHPYLTVVDGHALWVIDGYVLSPDYPGSASSSWAAMTGTGGAGTGSPYDAINYVRNAAKVTVDAHDGTVRIYAWETDPILAAWQKAFPGTVHARSEIPGALLAHLRYPTDLFSAQRYQLRTYATATPERLIAGASWQLATNASGSQWISPQRLSLNGAWSATSAFADGHDLAAVFAADADAASPTYGTLRLFTVPAGEPIPSAVEGVVRENAAVKAIADHLADGSAMWGEMRTVPTPEGIVSFAPLYAVPSTAGRPPVLVDVAVAVGDRVGVGATLPAAIASLSRPASGPSASALLSDVTVLIARSQADGVTPAQRATLVRQAQAKLVGVLAALALPK